jgi:dTDP-4-dehydrorhamnose 3,5-epimerase
VVATHQKQSAVNVTELSIPGVFVLDSPVHADDRGFFREWFKLPDLTAAGLTFHAEQANLSLSERNVVRGLHYSIAPEGQAKLVTCVLGQFDDVIVDIREGSPHFGRYEVVQLAADAGLSVLVPAGVAHGFCVTSEMAEICYLLSSPYNGPMELEINPFDEEIGVPWAISGEAIVSDKDANAPTLAQRAAARELTSFD